jgi:hypothetical protein
LPQHSCEACCTFASNSDCKANRFNCPLGDERLIASFFVASI